MYTTPNEFLHGLKPDESLAYSAHKCSVCNTVGARYGFTSRLLVTHETVLLNLLLGAQCSDEPQIYTFRCPFEPWRVWQAIQADSDLSAAAAIELAYLSVLDHLEDNGKWAVFAHLQRWWLNRAHRAAVQVLEQIGFDTAILSNLPEAQDAAEAEDNSNPIQPTAMLSADLFVMTGQLANQPQNEPILEILGTAYGAYLYLRDAYDDYAKDVTRGYYNPLKRFSSSGDGQSSPSREGLEWLLERCREISAVIHTHVYGLHIYRYQSTIAHLLYTPVDALVSELRERLRPELLQASVDAQRMGETPLLEKRIEAAIEKGLGFLEEGQSPAGGFETMMAKNPEMLGAVPVPVVFTTSLILDILQKVAPSSNMVNRARQYLYAHMELGWAWRYNENTSVPLDWDDTVCAQLALNDVSLWPPALAHYQTYQLDDGWYCSFMPDLAPHDGLVEANEVDAVVNMNLLTWLARANVADTCLAANLRRWIDEGFYLRPTPYYVACFPFAYFLSRTVCEGPVPELTTSLRQVAQQILDMEHNGSGWNNVLENALAITVVMRAGLVNAAHLEHIVHLILNGQASDGGWEKLSFIRGFRGHEYYWGSHALTTAFALEALWHYRSLWRN